MESHSHHPGPHTSSWNEEAVVARFTSHGVKPTAIRRLVYRELGKVSHPLSLRDMEERLVTMDKSTIFRALSLLLQHHLIHGIEDGSGSLKYELCHGHDECTPDDQHTHFFCECCHRTFCLPSIPVPQVELPQGFRVNTINYIVKGICPQCASEQ